MSTSTSSTKKKKYTQRVYIDEKPYELMRLWAKLAGKKGYEFTCFGRTVIEDGDPRVTDAYLVKHEGTASSVEADEEDVVLLMMKLNSEGIPPDEAFRCWVHSHPGNGPSATYLSSTDEANIDRIMTGEWLVSIVFDSSGNNPYCRVDTKSPRMRVEAELVVLEPPVLNDAEIKDAEELFEEKSSRRAYQSSTGKGTSYPSPHRQVGFGGYDGTGYYRSGYGGQSYGGQSYSAPATKPGTSSGSSAGGYRGTPRALPQAGQSQGSSAKTATPPKTSLSKEDEELLREHLTVAFDLDNEDVQNQWIAFAVEHRDQLASWREAFSMSEDSVHSIEIPATEETDDAIDVEGEEEEEILVSDGDGVPVGFTVVSETELLFELDDGDVILSDDEAVTGDTVPSYSPASAMEQKSRDEDLDRIAENVLSKVLSENEAIDLAMNRHNLREAEAQVELAKRIG